MVKAIIFDCFGVLVVDALSEMRAQLAEKSPDKADEIVELLHAGHRGSLGLAESNARIAGLLGLTLTEYRRQIDANEAKNHKLMSYIRDLRGRGYKTAILSNISIGGIDRRFNRQEIKQYFDTVVASGDLGYAKPEAQIYEITAERLDVLLSECVFTDDNEEYCDAARGLGMQAILYTDFAHFKQELEALLI